MATLKDEIRSLLTRSSGLTDREITNRLRGPAARQQPTNAACHDLARAGELQRRQRDDGLIGNYPPGSPLARAKREPDGPGKPEARSGTRPDQLSEDKVKQAVVRWLDRDGWVSEVAWGRRQGIDIEARRADERWVIEAKGCGSSQAMRVNYFLAALGETLQRMNRNDAGYAIALPDMPQYRRLWERLPALAKMRTRIGALFVEDAETIHHRPEFETEPEPSSRCYIPSGGPLAWQNFLAEPDRPWKTGYSAKALAHSWEAQQGLPDEVTSLIRTASRYAEEEPELLIALPEWEVALPGGSKGSHNDVLALIGVGDDLLLAAVDGKVSEAFGPLIEDWFARPSEGKRERLRYLCGLLGISYPPPGHLRYQLFHRTASAVIERDRFRAHTAAMIVHSFSPEEVGLDDYGAFVEALGAVPDRDRMIEARLPDGSTLLLGWACGDTSHLWA